MLVPVLAFLAKTSSDWLIVMEAVLEYKGMSFSHDQNSKCPSTKAMNSRLKSAFHLVVDCVFTLEHTKCASLLCVTPLTFVYALGATDEGCPVTGMSVFLLWF